MPPYHPSTRHGSIHTQLTHPVVHAQGSDAARAHRGRPLFVLRPIADGEQRTQPEVLVFDMIEDDSAHELVNRALYAGRRDRQDLADTDDMS